MSFNACVENHPINSHHVSAPSTFFLAHHCWLLSNLCNEMEKLETLSQAGDIVKQLQDLQKEMREIQERLPPSQTADGQPRGVLRTSLPKEIADPTTRIREQAGRRRWTYATRSTTTMGTTAAHDKVCVVEVSQRTQEHLTRSFVSMKNSSPAQCHQR